MQNETNTQNMTTIKILRAANKRHNNKIGYYNVEDGTINIGRTTYNIGLGSHQPNIPNNDYKPVDHTIYTAKKFLLFKLDANHLNCGMWIKEFEIIK